MATAKVSLPWQRAVEPWYLSYALLAVAVGGLAPILTPLAVASAGSAAHVGVVMAAIGFGQLTAAIWGTLVDRLRCHRALYAGGTLVVALAMAAIPHTRSGPLWIALALLLGVGAAAALTVANLLIVEAHPRDEWDSRIGWLQTFYSAGSVAGLVVAGELSHLPHHLALLNGAGLTVVGSVLGWLTTRTPARPAAPARPPLPDPRRPAAHLAHLHLSPEAFAHYVSGRTLGRLGVLLRSPLALFMAIWFIVGAGPACVYALYPLLMREVYSVTPAIASFVLAASTAASMFLYTPASKLVHHVGSTVVLQMGLAVRLAGLLAMIALALLPVPGREALALAAFVIVQGSWPLISVSGTLLVSALAPASDQGEAMGLFNTNSGLGGMAGAAFGGWVASTAGYNATSIVGAISLVIGLPLTLLLRPRKT